MPISIFSPISFFLNFEGALKAPNVLYGNNISGVPVAIVLLIRRQTVIFWSFGCMDCSVFLVNIALVFKFVVYWFFNLCLYSKFKDSSLQKNQENRKLINNIYVAALLRNLRVTPAWKEDYPGLTMEHKLALKSKLKDIFITTVRG